MEEREEKLQEEAETVEAQPAVEQAVSLDDYRELNDKYLRLYAEFDNYRKRMAKDKEELAKYANESLVYELLTSIDNLEIALKHACDGSGPQGGITEGVGNTLRELQRTLEKSGLKPIEALEKPFNPEFHHAMAQVERDDMEPNTVVEEYRKGYMFRDKVLRATLVAVSKKPQAPQAPQAAEEEFTEDDVEIIENSEE